MITADDFSDLMTSIIRSTSTEGIRWPHDESIKKDIMRVLRSITDTSTNHPRKWWYGYIIDTWGEGTCKDTIKQSEEYINKLYHYLGKKLKLCAKIENGYMDALDSTPNDSNVWSMVDLRTPMLVGTEIFIMKLYQKTNWGRRWLEASIITHNRFALDLYFMDELNSPRSYIDRCDMIDLACKCGNLHAFTVLSNYSTYSKSIDVLLSYGYTTIIKFFIPEYPKTPLGKSAVAWMVMRGVSVRDIKAGGNLDVVETKDDKWNILHYACAYNRPDVVRKILKKGGDPNAHIDGVCTPLYVATVFRTHECIDILSNSGGKIEGEWCLGSNILSDAKRDIDGIIYNGFY